MQTILPRPADMAAIRHMLGLTREGMAHALHASPRNGANTVAKYERGAVRPSGTVAFVYGLYAAKTIDAAPLWRLEGAFAGAIPEYTRPRNALECVQHLRDMLSECKRRMHDARLFDDSAEHALRLCELELDAAWRGDSEYGNGRKTRAPIRIVRDANRARRSIYRAIRARIEEKSTDSDFSA